MNVRGVRMRAAAAAVSVILAAGLIIYLRDGTSGGGPVADTGASGPVSSAPATPPPETPPETPSPDAPQPGTHPPGHAGTRRVALNAEPSDLPRLKALGYDLADITADASLIAGVPAGMRALLWVGNVQCGDFELDLREFKDAVQRFGHNPRVYGWYLSDEPDPRSCPEVAGELRLRADYIRRHAPGQVSFVSLTDFPMRPVAPDRIHADLYGVNPYPCRGSAVTRARCNFAAMEQMVKMADTAGIPRSRIAPVLQTFGQSCSDGEREYWLPTREQFREILAQWDRLVPRPRLEVSYSWGRQDGWVCPGLADASGGGHPDLQSLIKARYAR